jgi:phosphatidate cytidylyltransferase
LSNIVIRTLTGIIIVVSILGSILLGKFFFGALFLLFTILGTFEFFQMLEKSEIIAQKYFGTVLASVLYSLLFLVAIKTISAMYLVVIVLLVFVIPVRELYRTDSDKPLANISATLFGIVYVAIPFGLMNFMFYYGNPKFETFHLLLAFFVILWTADTFAYLVGSKIGKNRLFERISPKKSWEGSIGGAIAALIAGSIFSIWFNEMSLALWLGYALVIVVSGTYGDLVESMFKRSLDIKDSGNILPGHGGILDRFDAVFLSVPAAILYLMFIS